MIEFKEISEAPIYNKILVRSKTNPNLLFMGRVCEEYSENQQKSIRVLRDVNGKEYNFVEFFEFSEIS